jgi:hypothetical protein
MSLRKLAEKEYKKLIKKFPNVIKNGNIKDIGGLIVLSFMIGYKNAEQEILLGK